MRLCEREETVDKALAELDIVVAGHDPVEQRRILEQRIQEVIFRRPLVDMAHRMRHGPLRSRPERDPALDDLMLRTGRKGRDGGIDGARPVRQIDAADENPGHGFPALPFAPV